MAAMIGRIALTSRSFRVPKILAKYCVDHKRIRLYFNAGRGQIPLVVQKGSMPARTAAVRRDWMTHKNVEGFVFFSQIVSVDPDHFSAQRNPDP